MADDITLKMNVDTSDALWAIDKFNQSAEKAFKSSNSATQAWGQSLNKATSQMTKIIAKMSDIESGKLPTSSTKELQSELKKTNAEIAKTEKNIDNLRKHPIETTEYTQWKTILEGVNTQLKTAQSTLASYEKPTAWTDEFRGTTKQLASLQTKLDSAKATLSSFTTRGVYSGAEFYKAQQEVYKYQQKVSNLKVQLYSLEQAGRKYADNTGFNKAKQDVADLTTQANQAETAMTNLENSGKRYDTSKLDAAVTKLDTLKTKAQSLTTALTTPQDYTQSAEYQRLASQLTDCYNRATILNNKVSDVNSNLRSTTGSSSSFKNGFVNAANTIISKLRSIKSETGKTQSSHNKSFKSMLTTVLKYGFGIRSIFLLYKKVRSTISTGLTEMSKQFSDVADDVYTLKNSWSGFKSSLVSAFQPILSYVVPILSTLINYLTSAMNAIANFFALLTGQSYYYKAVKGNESVADSIGGTGSAAEEANEELAEYDDLIVIDQDSSSGGGGGSGSSDSDAWNWEKVDVTASSLADKLSNIWDVFKSAWENKGEAVVTAAKYALESFKSLLTTVADTIYQVFIDGYGQTWLESVLGVVEQILLLIGDINTAWETAWTTNNTGYNLVASFFTMLTAINDMISSITLSFRNAWNDDLGVSICTHILNILTNINNTIANLATNFTTAWNTAGIGDKIMTDILDIVDDIAGVFDRVTASTEKWSQKLDFYPLLVSIHSAMSSFEDILDTILSILADIYEEYILPIAEYAMEDAIPKFLESCSTGLDGIDKLLKSIEPYLVDYILPALEKITELGLDVVLAGFNQRMTEFNDACSKISTTLDTLKGYLDDLGISFISVKDSTEDTASGIETAWNILKTAITANPITLQLTIIKDSFTLTKIAITTVWSALVDFFSGLWEDIKAVFSGVKDWFKEKFDGALDVIKDIFNMDDDTTWKDIGKNIVEGIWEGFEFFTPVVWVLKDFFNWVVDEIKELFGINSPAENVKFLGENILLGIMQGFKDKFDTIKETIQSFKDTLVSKVKEKFGDIKDKLSEAIGNFSITSLLGLNDDTNSVDIVTNITSTFLGGLLSLADFELFNTTWTNIKNSFKNITNTIKSKFSGIFSKITDVDTLKTSWTNLKSTWNNVSAQLKATLAGKLREIVDIDTIQSKYQSLYDTWKSKSADLKANLGGKISKITDLDTWKTKFSNVWEIWEDASATFTASLKGVTSIGKLGDTSDPNSWYSNIKNLVGAWVSPATASFTTSFDTTLDTIGSWYTAITDLYNAWKGKPAEFDLKFSAEASDLKSWVNTNVISKINAQFDKVPILKNHHIPLLARGGIVDNATLFMAGEAGQEAVIPLERNLQWVDKMASMISDKLVNAYSTVPIINGNILPSSREFTQIVDVGTRNIEALLEGILSRLDDVESASHAPIELIIDGKVITQVVWDEANKRYRQSGTRFAY